MALRSSVKLLALGAMLRAAFAFSGNPRALGARPSTLTEACGPKTLPRALSVLHARRKDGHGISREAYRGVYGRANGKFAAQVTVQGQRKIVGTYDDAEAAARAYDQAAMQYFGSKARSRLNFPDEFPDELYVPIEPVVDVALRTAFEVPEDAPHREALQNLQRDCIHDYWIPRLATLQRNSAIELLPQLVAENELGFKPPPSRMWRRGVSSATQGGEKSPVQKEGTLLHWVLQQKKEHPDKVLLVQVGEFFEAFGVDAVLLVEHAGLNPMGGKARAGCPLRNIQQTLDSLTAAGLTVAVFVEAADVEMRDAKLPVAKSLWGTYGLSSGRGSTPPKASGGCNNGKIKNRILAQVVSPSSSTYLYGLALSTDDIQWRQNMPVWGVRVLWGQPEKGHDAKGEESTLLDLVEIRLDAREAHVHRRIRVEEFRAHVADQGASGSMMFVEDNTLSSTENVRRWEDFKTNNLWWWSDETQLLPGTDKLAGSDTELATFFVEQVSRGVDMDPLSFRLVRRSGDFDTSTQPSAPNNRPKPLYVSTAAQLGILPTTVVPDPVAYVLPPNAPACEKKFVRSWLWRPPPPSVALDFQRLVGVVLPGGELDATPLPQLRAIPTGKIVAMIASGEGNAPLYREIAQCIEGLLQLLDPRKQRFDPLLEPLHRVAGYESGLEVPVEELVLQGREVLQAIRDAVVDSPSSTDFSDDHDIVPSQLFEKCELMFRGIANPDHPDMAKSLQKLSAAAKELCDTVREDIPPGYAEYLSFDYINVLIALKKLPGLDELPKEKRKKFKHPKDRKGKSISTRWTTERIEEALQAYKIAAGECEIQARRLLRQLSLRLADHLPLLVVSAHWAVVLGAALGHAEASVRQNWCVPTLPKVGDGVQGANSISLEGVAPFWMPMPGAVPRLHKGITTAETVLNDIVLCSGRLALLTAPNMSGKSTLMRSVLMSAILANCGFCIPAVAGEVPWYDAFFLRGAAHDAPSEGKSAWAVECEDMRCLLRDCGSRSLVAVDELGRGTSSRDGAALAGAILEDMCDKGMSGIFATHLFEMFDLALRCLPREAVDKRGLGREGQVVCMRMGVRETDRDAHGVEWTYKVEPGVCGDSLAMVTASRYGIPEAVLGRAQDLLAMRGGETNLKMASQHPSRKMSGTGTTDSENAKSLDTAIAVCCQLLDVDKQSFTVLEDRYRPPLAVDSVSVVYVLELLTKSAQENGGEFQTEWLYVGETDSFRQRLQQHRSLVNRNHIGASLLRCAYLEVPNKSRARETESTFIRALALEGFPLKSDADGAHHRFAK